MCKFKHLPAFQIFYQNVSLQGEKQKKIFRKKSTQQNDLWKMTTKMPYQVISRKKKKRVKKHKKRNFPPIFLGLDLSDSDDDATWTPFKAEQAAASGNFT